MSHIFPPGTGSLTPRNGFHQELTHQKDLQTAHKKDLQTVQRNNSVVDNSNNKTNSPAHRHDTSSINTATSDKSSVSLKKTRVGPGDLKNYTDFKNSDVCVIEDKGQDLVINNNSNKEMCCGIRVESSRIPEMQRSRERTTTPRTFCRNWSRISSTDIDSGVSSFAEHLTLSESHGNFRDVTWNDAQNAIRFGDKSYYSANMKDKTTEEMEHFPLHSRTCSIL